ncbi:MAG: bis(5'-nucleosyl)-tetraphosphatase (symmetrical) YqeK [Clostridia bacterium]|nr:bis(5'-nucleosyl)-tetraphosphatase (symmetrical) YqeK [Clostridia bacterium]
MTKAEMDEKLRSVLTEQRYRHSIGVMETAMRLAEAWGVSVEKAEIAGLLHDCAKDIPHEVQEQMLRNRDVPLDKPTAASPQLWHAVLGAELIQEEYGVTDPEIISAVRYHTTGRAEMSLLEKIIYVADCVEPNRTYDDREERLQLAFTDLDKSFLGCINWSIKSVISRDRPAHPDSLAARNEIILKESLA